MKDKREDIAKQSKRRSKMPKSEIQWKLRRAPLHGWMWDDEGTARDRENNSSTCITNVHYIESVEGAENKARALREGVTLREDTGDGWRAMTQIVQGRKCAGQQRRGRWRKYGVGCKTD